MTIEHHPKISAARRNAFLVLRRIGVATLLAIVAWGCWRGVRTWRGVVEDFHQTPHRVPPPTTGDLVSGFPVAFGQASQLRGWYTPSRNRAAIVLCHGTGADRRSLEPEAALLAAAGIGVLLFDFPGHGESGGTIQWAGAERNAVREAVDFLRLQTDVDSDRIGGLGFSFGGAILLGAASDDLRIRAVASIGSFADVEDLLRTHAGRLAFLFGPIAIQALQHTGVSVTDHRPLDVIARIAPRPLLLVHGSSDATVPIRMAHALFAAAHVPKRLVVIEGAGHGGYAKVAALQYKTALRTFFVDALTSSELIFQRH